MYSRWRGAGQLLALAHPNQKKTGEPGKSIQGKGVGRGKTKRFGTSRGERGGEETGEGKKTHVEVAKGENSPPEKSSEGGKDSGN